jgi:hypothetical protein
MFVKSVLGLLHRIVAGDAADTEDGSDMFLRNIGNNAHNSMVQQTKNGIINNNQESYTVVRW